MGEKLIVGPFNRGLRNDRPAFMIDNESFPILINAYQWRGRVKRKRGTQFLTRLSRYLGTTDGAGNLAPTILPVPIATGISSFVVGVDIFTDPGTTADPAVQTLLSNNIAATATLNRVTGLLTITGSQANTAVLYQPSLPVMGLEELVLPGMEFPGTLAFDTTYAYNISQDFPYPTNDVSFYKNPAADATTMPGYVPKVTWTRTWWNGEDYQQFWTVNYQGALWATNGITVPFTVTNIGMQYNFVTNVTINAIGPPAIATFTILSHGLVQGDFLFFNEFDPAIVTGLNFQTGYVILRNNANSVTVEFPFATLGGPGGATSTGIAQYLTNRSDTTKDGIRWYDGDPTNGSPTAPSFIQGHGWVNFAPPLSQNPFSISDLPPAQYYLVGARMIVPFKDRLLFFGPVVQTSAAGSQKYLPDAVIYSQNGTPYYTASYTNTPNAALDTPASSSNVFHPLLVPDNQTATSTAYFEDQTGFGGFIQAGVERAITTVSSNEDALIVGFDSNLQTRLIYSGNDIVPFNFYVINSELGSASTFSIVNLDHGVITKGNRGYIITSQTEVSRIDLEIPDEVFETKLSENGNERVCSQRDFINEWIYFTYPSNLFDYKFPTKTLQYNYRDNSWATFYETYTTYGSFRKHTGLSWAIAGQQYEDWDDWTDSWDAGENSVDQPVVIAGNQQGFVIVRAIGTGEEESLTIQNVNGLTITSPNHSLNSGDFIVIKEAQGTLTSSINLIPFQITVIDDDSFIVGVDFTGLTYLGGGLITRFYVPLIQTKQFPLAWELARKTRIGPQQYLFTTTDNSQITLQIYLSQNQESPYNIALIAPDASSDNALVYSQVIYTCPESTNLGLTPFNSNLQTPTAIQQAQIWHRMNTSLIGDTVQLGFTLSRDQMLDPDFLFQIDEIELHGFIIDVQPSQLLV